MTKICSRCKKTEVTTKGYYCKPCNTEYQRERRAKLTIKPVTITHKTCMGCNVNLTVDKFYQQTDSPDGLRRLCKKCNHTCNRLYKKGNSKTRYNWIKHLRGRGLTHTEIEWQLLKEHYNHRCISCGLNRKLTRDHIIPLTHGGDDKIGNIQPLCMDCNINKNSKIIDYRWTNPRHSNHNHEFCYICYYVNYYRFNKIFEVENAI